MSETTAQSANMETLRTGLNGDAGKSHLVTVPDHPGDQDNFYSWPTRTDALPEEWLGKIRANRASYPMLNFRDMTRDGNKSGYSYGGESAKAGKNPTELVTPAEAADPKLKEVVLKVYDEMHEEGGVSAVLTGDAAWFTWGRGISFKSEALGAALRDFILKAPAARTALLDIGFTILGSKNADLRVVDLASGTVKQGQAAAVAMDGREPAEERKQLLSAISKITLDHLQEASNAQWVAFKYNFMYSGHFKVPADVIATWPPEVVAFVVHLGAWGNFLNAWPEYGPTRGDLAKILRIAVKRNKHHVKGDHILVPYEYGGAKPSTTLLFGTGKEMLIKRGIVKPLAGYPGSALPDDIVFEIVAARQSKATGTHMVLRNPPAKVDPEAWVDANHGKSMHDLLKACEGLGYEQLRRTRDWYARLDPDTQMPAEKWGPRPRVAMDAVLHKGEKDGGLWVLAEAERAGITPGGHADQYEAIKAKLYNA